jgi:LysR family hydrogen peroxide-inducible transcriptional activator
MTFSQLEYTIALSKYGSFKRAADKLQISQPALSMQIRKLEEEVGILLFDRSKSPAETTRDGKLFIDRAQEILVAKEHLKNFSYSLSDSFDGVLRVGIIPTLSPFLVPLFTEELQADYPDFRLDISELITEKTVNGVRSGALDAGIISTPINVYGIVSMPLFYEKFYLYSSEDQLENSTAINLSSINYENLWLLDEGNCFRDQVNNFCDLNKIRKNRQFIYRSNSIDALIRLVDSKGGITILPELSTLSLSADQETRVKKISGTPVAREISIIVSKNNMNNRFVEKFRDYIQSNIPQYMLSSEGLEVVDPEIHMP